MQSKLHQWAVPDSDRRFAKRHEPPLIGTNTGRAECGRELHVRFGGQTAETHSLRNEQGAVVRPYTYIPTRGKFCT
ncbi:MAG: hypothetical protein F7O42_12160 [Opitutae bacterium]|nr:hypothetical protein [Opitutae bacterium]